MAIDLNGFAVAMKVVGDHLTDANTNLEQARRALTGTLSGELPEPGIDGWRAIENARALVATWAAKAAALAEVHAALLVAEGAAIHLATGATSPAPVASPRPTLRLVVDEKPQPKKPVEAAAGPDYENRNEAIAEIRRALRERSGKPWSVRGGTGTSWGWITISAPPSRCKDGEWMTDTERHELGELLGLSGPTGSQGQDVPASGKHYLEYVDRANGRQPRVYGTRYWD